MTKNDFIEHEAIRLGCSPFWHDGILGWAWHCDCENNAHGCDQQCSAITLESLARQKVTK